MKNFSVKIVALRTKLLVIMYTGKMVVQKRQSFLIEPQVLT